MYLKNSLTICGEWKGILSFQAKFSFHMQIHPKKFLYKVLLNVLIFQISLFLPTFVNSFLQNDKTLFCSSDYKFHSLWTTAYKIIVLISLDIFLWDIQSNHRMWVALPNFLHTGGSSIKRLQKCLNFSAIRTKNLKSCQFLKYMS